MKYLEQELAEEIASGMMSVSMEARGLVVSFREAAFFPSGTDVIPEQTYGTVASGATDRGAGAESGAPGGAHGLDSDQGRRFRSTGNCRPRAASP